MARKTNGSAIRSKKTVTPPTETASPVPATAQVTAELSPKVSIPAQVPAALNTKVSAPAPVPAEIKTAVSAPVAASVNKATNGNHRIDEEIRRRAYELFLQRNGNGGDPNRDWLVAEREVKARHATAGR